MLRCNARRVLQRLLSRGPAAGVAPAHMRKGPHEAGLFKGWRDRRAMKADAFLLQCAPAAASEPAPPRAGRDSQITGTSSKNISAEA